jgi:hypothetical protein
MTVVYSEAPGVGPYVFRGHLQPILRRCTGYLAKNFRKTPVPYLDVIHATCSRYLTVEINWMASVSGLDEASSRYELNHSRFTVTHPLFVLLQYDLVDHVLSYCADPYAENPLAMLEITEHRYEEPIPVQPRWLATAARTCKHG